MTRTDRVAVAFMLAAAAFAVFAIIAAIGSLFLALLAIDWFQAGLAIVMQK